MAEEVDWDYAPSYPTNAMSNQPFAEQARIFVEAGPERNGRIYRKAVYRAYADADFSRPLEHPAHLGILGPILRAEVGDNLIVHFRNATTRPLTIHPHGVFYDKANEGSPYADSTSGEDKVDDGIPPGGSYTYRWGVPERAGPGPADPTSIAWLYHSHVDEPADTNAGLIGAIIVTGKGKANPDATPRDIEQEFVTLFTVFDENASLYAEENLHSLSNATDELAEDEDFAESNLMHGINGYLWGNLRSLEMRKGERVRWHTLALGTEVDLHTPHWHGMTGLSYGRRLDVTE